MRTDEIFSLQKKAFLVQWNFIAAMNLNQAILSKKNLK